MEKQEEDIHLPKCINCGAADYADYGLPDQVRCLNCGMFYWDCDWLVQSIRRFERNKRTLQYRSIGK